MLFNYAPVRLYYVASIATLGASWTLIPSQLPIQLASWHIMITSALGCVGSDLRLPDYEWAGSGSCLSPRLRGTYIFRLISLHLIVASLHGRNQIVWKTDAHCRKNGTFSRNCFPVELAPEAT